jgi:hypothetical protein
MAIFQGHFRMKNFSFFDSEMLSAMIFILLLEFSLVLIQ